MIKIIKTYQGTAKNMSLYLIASMIPMFIQLAINPLIAMNMSSSDYAIRGYYLAFNVLFSPIVTFFFTNFYTKRYFELNQEKRMELKATIFKTLTTISFGVAFVLLLLLYFYISNFNTDSKIPFFPYSAFTVFSLPFVGIYTLTLVEYRMQKESKKFFWISVSNGIIYSSLTLLFVVLIKGGVLGALSATLLSNIIFWITCLIINRELFSVKFNKHILTDSIIFCWPLVLAAMFTFFSGGYDKILLKRLCDMESLGIYSVGAGIAGYLSVFTSSINDTFQPDVFKSIIQKRYKTTAKYIILKVSLITLVVVMFIIFAPFLIELLTAGRYVNSKKYAVIISLSSITSMLYHSINQVVIAKGFTHIPLQSKVIGSIISIALYYILINNYGAIGAAWGIVLSWLVFAIGLIALLLLKIKNTIR